MLILLFCSWMLGRIHQWSLNFLCGKVFRHRFKISFTEKKVTSQMFCILLCWLSSTLSKYPSWLKWDSQYLFSCFHVCVVCSNVIFRICSLHILSCFLNLVRVLNILLHYSKDHLLTFVSSPLISAVILILFLYILM